MLISGGTGTGKTTTLNALSAFVPNDERIVTIEDAAELQLQQEHVITLEARPPNIEGEGEIRIRELVRNALRMRPDRIIVGEVRGPETLDMLQAMNTGHEGSLTTIHANTPRDALSRLETLVLTAGVELPHRAIREQIASAFDLLVQIARLVDGSRRITHITEVLRMESDVITLQDVYVAKPPDEESAAAGAGKPVQLLAELECTGLKPHFLEKMAANGVILPPTFFSDGELVPAELRGRELRRVRVSRRDADPHPAPLRRRRPSGAGGGERVRDPPSSRCERVPDDPRDPRRAGRLRPAADPDRGRPPRGRPDRTEPLHLEERRDRRRPLAVDGRQAAGGRDGGCEGVPRRQGALRPGRRGCLRLEGRAADAASPPRRSTPTTHCARWPWTRPPARR